MLKRPAPRLHSRFKKLFLQTLFLLPIYIYTDFLCRTIRPIMKPSILLSSVARLTTPAGIPPPRAPMSRPQIPIKTFSTVSFSHPATLTPLLYRDSTASGDQNDGDSTYLPIPEQHWIKDSVRGIFSELRERVRVMTAEALNFVKLRLASSTTLDTYSNLPDIEVHCDDRGRGIEVDAT